MTRTASGSDHALGTRLYAASRHHARKARELAASSDEHERLDAAVHAGAALELIAKALLAEIDRCLLPDRAHHALLDAVAGQRESLAARPTAPKTTISAMIAVELVARLVPGCRAAEQSATAVIRARNAAVHLAVAPAGKELAGLVGAMEAFNDAAATALRGSSRDYWGIHFEDVTREREAREADIAARAHAAVAEAKKRYQHAIGSLPDDLREQVLVELRDRLILVGEEMGTVECPACAEEATTAWELDIDVEEELPGDFLYSPYLVLVGLGCSVCGLRLDPDEIEALGLEPDEPEPTPDDEYYRD